MKELPIGRQTFSEFIEQDLLYVDKTHYVWELVRQGKFYFLSRPPRFGKSLLLSTLKSFFEGREELFQGLYLHDKVKEWKKHPIVRMKGLDSYLRFVMLTGVSRFAKVGVFSGLNNLEDISMNYSG